MSLSPAFFSAWPRKLLLTLGLIFMMGVFRSLLLPTRLPTPTQSAYRCLGSDADKRRCVFENVCVSKASDGNWDVKFGIPSEEASLDDIEGSMSPGDATRFVALRAEASYRKDSLKYVGLETVPWSVINANNNTWHQETWVLYQLIADGDMNFGHFMLDDVFGVWDNLQELGVESTDIRVGAVKACAEFGYLEERCLRQEVDLWPTVTKHPVQSISKLLDQGTQCFRELVIGTGASGGISFGSFNTNRARAFRDYRHAIFAAHAVAPDTRTKRIHILLVQKRGRRSFVNFWETANALKLDPLYASYKWTVTDSFDTLSFSEQLRLLASVDIALTPCGGISMSFILLPPGSSLIVAAYPHVTMGSGGEVLSTQSGHMEGHLWIAQSHVYVQHLEIDSSADFEIPKEFTKPDWNIHRNEANIVLSKARVEPYLQRALQQALTHPRSLRRTGPR